MVKRLFGILVVCGFLLCVFCACKSDLTTGEEAPSSPVTTTSATQKTEQSHPGKTYDSTQSTTAVEGELPFDQLEPNDDYTTTTSTTSSITTRSNTVVNKATDSTSTHGSATTSNTKTSDRVTSGTTVAPPIDDDGYGPIVKP